jgi:hypothetical protein
MANQLFRKKGTQPMTPWTPGLNMEDVSISQPDRDAGSPRRGDMIATNPKSPSDRWLVAAQYFADNYEPV